MGRTLALLSAACLLAAHAFALSNRACAGAVAAGTFRITVKTPAGGTPLPLRRMNIIPANSKLIYEPLQMPADLRKGGRVAMVIVPADAEQRAASGASVLEAHDANVNGEWTIPYRAGVVLGVFGPQGLDEKRLTNLVTKDEDLLDDLARFAQQTVDLETSLEQLNALEEDDVEEDPSKPSRATPVEQALFTLTRALNPSSTFINPLGGGKSVGPVTRTTWAASTFFDNAGGLFPGSGALGMVRQWLMPDSEFRAVYAETAEVDGLTFCTQKQLTKSKNRIVYMWGYKPVNTGAPKVSVPQATYFPSGARSTFAMRVAAPDDFNLTGNIHDWALVGANGKETPVRVRAAARGWMEIDLRKTVIEPGPYKLKGKWDWDSVVVDGDLRVSPLGDMRQARVTADSQLRLVETNGMIPFELEGADFQFVEHVTLKRAGALGAANRELEFRLPSGWRAGVQTKLELEIDGSRYRAGDYLLAIQQSGGATQDVPMRILPPLPRISGLPLRLNSAEPRQKITLRGSGLDRIEAFEADGMKFELGAAGNDNQRDVTVLLAANNSAGTKLPASYRLNGLALPIKLPFAFQVAGPKPRIASATAGTGDEQGVAMRDGEVPAGSLVGFTLKVENADAPAILNVECSEAGRQVLPLKIRLGERRADAKLGAIGPGAWFAAFDPGTVGQSGCTLNATVETEATGRSAAVVLGKVVRLPRIDQLTWTDEKSQGGYVAVLSGADLETIERAGWDAASNGLAVANVPRQTGDKQTLRVVLPWPPPSPLAPLQIWLRGEQQPRVAKAAR